MREICTLRAMWGGWKRSHGYPYTGTKGETPDTAKGSPTGHRASPRPYQLGNPLATRNERRRSVPSFAEARPDRTPRPVWGSQFGRFGPHPRASTSNVGLVHRNGRTSISNGPAMELARVKWEMSVYCIA